MTASVDVAQQKRNARLLTPRFGHFIRSAPYGVKADGIDRATAVVRTYGNWRRRNVPDKLRVMFVPQSSCQGRSRMEIPQSLIQQLVLGRVVPFVGSGVSLAVRPGLFPTWKELLKTLAERLQQESKADAAEIVRRYVKKGQFNKAADEAFDELGLARSPQSSTCVGSAD